MADVTGPISTLSGALYKPQGDCDEHPGVKATRRVQGETDSMGCEMHDMCEPCYVAMRQAIAEYAVEAATGTCDWCASQVTDLRQRRDYDEGMCGPVYQVCGACRERQNKEAQEEIDSMDRENSYY